MTQSRYTHQDTSLLFPTPLLTYRIADAERINALLLEEIAARQQAEAGVVRSNQNGWHSEHDFFARAEPGHRALAWAIHDTVIDATLRLGPATQSKYIRFQLNGWINVNPPDAYNVPHDHPGSFWSGCYYLANDESGDANTPGGAISFLDQRHAPAGQPSVKAPIFAGNHTLRPVPGTLLLFPGNAKHWVHPNTSASDRISVAFNANAVRGRPETRSAAEVVVSLST